MLIDQDLMLRINRIKIRKLWQLYCFDKKLYKNTKNLEEYPYSDEHKSDMYEYREKLKILIRVSRQVQSSWEVLNYQQKIKMLSGIEYSRY